MAKNYIYLFINELQKQVCRNLSARGVLLPIGIKKAQRQESLGFKP